MANYLSNYFPPAPEPIATPSPVRAQSLSPIPTTRSSNRVQGTLDIGGNAFNYASGGRNRGNVPFGTYDINPYTPGEARAAGGYSYRKDAFPIAGELPDKRYPGAPRTGILIHGSSAADIDKVLTSGCLGIPSSQWPQAKQALLDMQKQYGKLVLDVTPNGASVMPAKGYSRKNLDTVDSFTKKASEITALSTPTEVAPVAPAQATTPPADNPPQPQSLDENVRNTALDYVFQGQPVPQELVQQMAQAQPPATQQPGIDPMATSAMQAPQGTPPQSTPPVQLAGGDMPAGWTPERLGAMQELDRRGALSPVQSGALKEILRRQGGGAPSAVTGLQQTPTAQQQPESYGGALETAINSFADAATLGLSGKAQSYLAAKAAQAGLFGEGAKGQPFDKLYAAAEELRRQRDAGLSAENPYASAAGTVAGALGTGVVAGRTAARMGFKPAERIGGRLAQYAKGGAAVGAAEQIIDKGGVSGDTLAAAALGGAAGAAGGGLTEKLVPLLAPGMGRAWRKLAAQIRTPVEDIAAFVDDAIQKTGKVPSVAQVFHARDQGVLKGWAARHNTFGTSFDEAAMAARGQDISVGQLRRARTDAFEASIGPIRDTPVQVSKDLLGDTHVADALRGPKMKDIRIKINDGDPLTVGDVDRMRQKLRDMQKAEPGGPFGDYADQLRDDTAAQLPEYGAALDKYFKDSRYIEGFESGMAGKSLSEVSDKVQLPEGVAGHEAGAATRKGQRALSNMAPSSVASEADIPGASEMARGAGHIAVGGPALGTFHVGQSVRSALDHLPEKMQQELAAGLLSRDPAVVRATLGKMRKAGTSLKTIRQLATGMGLYSGASAVQGATTEHKPLEITVTHGATQ